MRKLRFDIATFSLLLTGVNGAIFYLAPSIPDVGVRGFVVVFLEGFIVWLSSEEKKDAPTSTTGVATT